MDNRKAFCYNMMVGIGLTAATSAVSLRTVYA